MVKIYHFHNIEGKYIFGTVKMIIRELPSVIMVKKLHTPVLLCRTLSPPPTSFPLLYLRRKGRAPWPGRRPLPRGKEERRHMGKRAHPMPLPRGVSSLTEDGSEEAPSPSSSVDGSSLARPWAPSPSSSAGAPSPPPSSAGPPGSARLPAGHLG